ncbi:hypothetical protein TeGR_g7951 [Tetraparma gracilis]|uniref:NAD(P)-binding protein n=1 Tax=Tetraparma gracilis TaxID=2962635 RepID=A0ABQ6MZ01_9STRA|nr:hypothetical protein TeGR_g7951 [Tetraparma gracilis]
MLGRLLLALLLPLQSNAFLPPPLPSPPSPLRSYYDAESDSYIPKGENLGIVITGGANGVGFAYAKEFLRLGHRVVIADVANLDAPVAALKREFGEAAPVFAKRTDVSVWADVDALGDFAAESLGAVHHWINNAGVNGGRRALLDVPVSEVQKVVQVNLLGKIFCTKRALELLGKQEGVTSHLYNTVGSGVKGGGTPGYACYGATKRGLPQFTDSLKRELEEGVQGYEKKEMPGDVKVHTLSPGMVFTKLLLEDSTPELRKFPFGVLAAQPEEVAQDLVPKILAAGDSGTSVEFLGTDRILTKFFERFVLQKKSAYIDDNGNVIKLPGEEYDVDGVKALY